MLFDSHTHINEDSFTEEERNQLIKEIVEDKELSYVIDIGYDINSSRQGIADAEAIEKCYAAVGVHPSDTKDMTQETLEELREIARHPKVKAIGEIGLDFHYDDTDPVAQEKWFRAQIKLAKELKMPISIHSRDADQKTMDILKEEGAFDEERKADFPKRVGPGGVLCDDARVVLHCFSGSSELAKEYIKLGATISIAGPVTYKNNKKTVKVVEEVPLEFLMIETDAPYLAPVPHRGKKNKSPYVEHTARKIAEIKGISYEEVARQTCRNGIVFFCMNNL